MSTSFYENDNAQEPCMGKTRAQHLISAQAEAA